jgi:hypothetical protein
MALEITFYSGYDRETQQVYGMGLGGVSYTVTGSSAAVMTTIPAGAKVARIKAGEICRVSNNGRAADNTAAATNGVHLSVGEVIDLEVFESKGLKAITST